MKTARVTIGSYVYSVTVDDSGKADIFRDPPDFHWHQHVGVAQWDGSALSGCPALDVIERQRITDALMVTTAGTGE